MSARIWKRTRRRLRRYRAELDAYKRKHMRVPLWRRILSLLFPAIRKNWEDRWERKHRQALKMAMKKTSHIVRRIAG